MIKTASLGWPRFGADRKLKFAIEAFWADTNLLPLIERLSTTASQVRREGWEAQKVGGIDIIPSNDFSLYDHVLDQAIAIGAVPDRFILKTPNIPALTFAMARGMDGIEAMEMTKWFDTNYHYIVPELHEKTEFRYDSGKAVREFLEAKSFGIVTRPVILGPITFLSLSKIQNKHWDPIDLLPRILAAYSAQLRDLAKAGAEWVQIDEPILSTDLSDKQKKAFRSAYANLTGNGVNLMLTSYFGGMGDNLALALSLPVQGFHVDVSKGLEDLGDVSKIRADQVISVGVVDGRNVWKTDLDKAIDRVGRVRDLFEAENVIVAPSCSFLHVPLDVNLEYKDDIKKWCAFAKQKVEEIDIIRRGVEHGRWTIDKEIKAANAVIRSRETDPSICVDTVRSAASSYRHIPRLPWTERQKAQQESLNLPPFPTTTIGSFPQTKELRNARAAAKGGGLWNTFKVMVDELTADCIRKQEEIGLDVLVHGEFERDDMVAFFAAQLKGMTTTEFGWVQSYGTRMVRPPIIFGDVYRPHDMTVEMWEMAQGLTKKPMKGILTGPTTILRWSFVRDDLPQSEVAKQIALAVRAEVLDLEQSGCKVIQVDEPAFREGLPLRKADRAHYLQWAISCFKIATGGVKPSTQIHTHMCYSEFNEIVDAIAEMDADVISIESSRSGMAVLEAITPDVLKKLNAIGPGVYDIHSPRVPNADEVGDLISRSVQTIPVERMWVNPDCGLKTRGWPETEQSLRNMVEAAKKARGQ